MRLSIPLLLVFTVLISCSQGPDIHELTSPNGRLVATLELTEGGSPQYTLELGDQVVIEPSTLGMKLKSGEDLSQGFRFVNVSMSSYDEIWERPWGESRLVQDNHTEGLVELDNEDGVKLNIRFRLFNDGLAFRYEFPQQEGFEEIVISEENTQFNMTGNHESWWIPADWEIYEHLWTRSRLSEIDAGSKRNNTYLAQTYIPDPDAVSTPFTMKTDEGLYISIHEAALYNYAGMTVHVDKETFEMNSALVAWENGDKVRTSAPFKSPWRTIMVTETAGDLVESNMIVNLNEPNKIEDTDWIEPMKYVGIWWEMHLGKSSWAMEGGQHGATTENARNYIDFAAANNIKGVLIEGWNTGWEEWVGEDREGIFDFVTPYPDFDLPGVVEYAKSKGVEIIGHHETSGDVGTYDKQMVAAYELYNSLGISAVKTGYVGTIIPATHYHHGQYMVEHYQRSVETAARYKIAIDAHEPIKATGIRRTWPNFVSREGLRGQEFNAWSDMNPPEHTLILPFTRMLAGPIDFTPGIFNIKLAKLTGKVGMQGESGEMFDNEDNYKPDNQINTTLAKQLALYVTIYSPVQMAADLPEHYETMMDAFQFIRDVPVDWENSRVLEAEIEEHLTMVRQEKGSDNWFLGSITDTEAREFEFELDFLADGKTYQATIYSDGEDAHWDDNPMSYNISQMEVKKGDIISVKLAPGGGQAISFITEE